MEIMLDYEFMRLEKEGKLAWVGALELGAWNLLHSRTPLYLDLNTRFTSRFIFNFDENQSKALQTLSSEL